MFCFILYFAYHIQASKPAVTACTIIVAAKGFLITHQKAKDAEPEVIIFIVFNLIFNEPGFYGSTNVVNVVLRRRT